jgi:hypothetical protein
VKRLIALLFALSFGANAFANTEYKACVDQQPSICATLNFSSAIDSQSEGVFVVKVETPTGKSVENFALKLWMQMGSMGHPGAPVDLSDLGQNSYQVQNAWFFMPGTWLIQMSFTYEGTSYHLEVPIQVSG